MKNILFTLVCLIFGVFTVNHLNAQCTPGNSTSCPDPENNGQICPATLAEANAGQSYSQQFTILPPAEYIIDTVNGITIQLHHIKIKDIGNLPEGITWESNTSDSIFTVGIYYCVLLAGTPTTAGNYPLKIVVDIYVPGILGSPPIFVGTITDSTSLAIDVNPTGIIEFSGNGMKVLRSAPNPFTRDLDVSFTITKSQQVTFQLFNLLGRLIYSEQVETYIGENHILFDGSLLNPGVYLYTLSDSENHFTQRVIKSN